LRIHLDRIAECDGHTNNGTELVKEYLSLHDIYAGTRKKWQVTQKVPDETAICSFGDVQKSRSRQTGIQVPNRQHTKTVCPH